ncbi:MAG: HesA/MoeB/ThiF family protein [Nitrospirae bacterium]|nr:HesA/MoeB/ThiF family protein [Nitrospirota bacterium]
MLTERELERYRRQLMIEGFDLQNQKRLKNSTALVAGIGGVGGTAAVYLAVAGIGKLVFVHAGNLTLSNMNRQILMKHNWIGSSRVVQARKTIQEINPDVQVEIYDERISEDNIYGFLRSADIALSARPNFQERRVLNEACLRLGIPMIEGAMNGMQGYMFNVIPGQTPCLNCVFPEDDPEWEELGFPVLGAVSGVLGCLMSIEAIKILTGFKTPLMNKMLLFNTADMEFRKVNIYRDQNCSYCIKKHDLESQLI